MNMFPRPVKSLCTVFRRHYSSCGLSEVGFKRKDIHQGITAENQFEILSDVITPFRHFDYAKQLLMKKKWSRQVVEKIKSHKLRRSRTLIHNVIPSPVIESYRNKDEFSIRNGIDGNPKTVGFFVGSPARGETVCVPPKHLNVLKEDHVYLSQVYQDIIRDSPLKACHDLHDGGFWRGLIVRSNIKGELMVIVIVHPKGASDAELKKVKAGLVDKFMKSNSNICSLYLQACPHVRCTNDQAPFILLHGQEHLYETIDDLQFRISPGSFFQVNTEAASVLYQTSLELLSLDQRDTLLDLCCGIGTFSLIASRFVRGCVGIEYVNSSIEDAKFNSNCNNLKNCHFISGLLERSLGRIFSDLDNATSIVPFVNPGRAGIHQHVVKLLRRNPSIQRLVYVSCKADNFNAMKNFVDLCSPSLDKSKPFSLTNVVGLDMFPQTSQCELILLFER